MVERVKKDHNRTSEGPLLYTLLDKHAEEALEHIDLDELSKENGADTLFAVLDQRS